MDLWPYKQQWRRVAESKARVKGLKGIMKEGIGVAMVESYARNLEEQSRVRVGQGKEERNVVKWSMVKFVNDSKRQLKQDIDSQNKMRLQLKECLGGTKTAKFRRTNNMLNREAREAGAKEEKRFNAKETHLGTKNSEVREERQMRPQDRPVPPSMANMPQSTPHSTSMAHVKKMTS